MNIVQTAMRMTVLFAALQIGVVGVAWACSCTGDFNEADYDVVFTGTHEGTSRLGMGCGGSGFDPDHSSRFVVTDPIKGVQMGEDIKVLHGVSDGACGVRFDDRTTWTVYANENADGELTTNLCSVQ